MGFMKKFVLEEDRPTPKCIYNFKLWFSSGIAAFAAMMIGYDSAFIGTSISITSFKDEFDLSRLSSAEFGVISANIVSTYLCGAFAGCIVAFPLGYKYGRRITLMSAAVLAVIGAALNTAASNATGLSLIYAGRALLGVAVGMSTNMTPLYLAEISPPAIRGALIGVYEVNWQAGGLVGFWINYGITQHIAYSKKQWLIPFAMQLVPAGLFFVGLFFLKESPRWLITKGRDEEAARILCYLRNLPADHEYIRQELDDYHMAFKKDFGTSGQTLLGPFKTLIGNKNLLRRIAITTTLFVWQNASGVNAINYYSPTIFRSLGITGQSTALFSTGLFGVVKTVFMAIWLVFLIDRVGRRRLLLFGSVMAAFCHYFIGGYIAVAKPVTTPGANVALTPAGTAAVFMIYLYTACYTVSWSGTPWAVGSESFPGSVRNAAQLCTAASNWFWTIWITRFTPQMFAKMGFGVYMLFASMMVVSIPFVYFLVPETKNLPIEAMDQLWDYRPVRHAHDEVMAKLRLEHGLDGGRQYQSNSPQDLEDAGGKDSVQEVERK